MYYLFVNPTNGRYIQLTFKGNHVNRHTQWSNSIPSDFTHRLPTDSWSTRSDWFSPHFKFNLVTRSNVPITPLTHPELLI
jgi:hypothetical protein